MELKDSLAIIVATMALIVSGLTSGLTYYHTRRIGERQVRFSNRTEFHKILIELNKEAIREPALRCVYDHHPMPIGSNVDPQLAGKIESFAYVKLNMFEMVYLFHHENGKLRTDDIDYWNTWEKFFLYNVKHSSVFRRLLERHDLDEYYSHDFITFIRSKLPHAMKDAGS